MSDIRFTLVSDGSSDRALIPILSWVLRQQTINRAIQSEWADLRRLRKPPRSLADKIAKSLELYPCDLLFIHRDTENQDREHRIQEIEAAIYQAGINNNEPPHVCVVPVRMQEAWLLFDEGAIRRAAGNPNGHQPLNLPPLGRIEALADPKRLLHDLLREASGLKGRRLKAFGARRHAPQVSTFITDFATLRMLSAFEILERDIRAVVTDNRWDL